jgi:recombination protein RecA
MASLSSKFADLKKIIAGINKAAGEVLIGTLDDETILEKLKVKFIPTPNDDLNEAVGGGFPRGRISIVSGLADSGKTGLCLETIGQQMQKDPDFIVLWLESENSLTDITYIVEQFKIDPKRFLLINMSATKGAEEALSNCLDTLKSGVIDMFVINSLRGLTPKTELNKSISEDTVAMQARMNTKLLKQLVPTCSEKDIACVIIQHLTTMIGTMSKDPFTLGGGLLLKYASVLTLDMRKQTVQDTDPIGKDEGMKIKVSVKKNHVCPRINPYVKVDHFVVYGEGTEVIMTTMQKAVEQNILKKTAGWISWPDKELKWNGAKNFRTYMKENSDVFQTLRNIVNKNIQGLTDEEMNELGIDIEENNKTIDQALEEIEND